MTSKFKKDKLREFIVLTDENREMCIIHKSWLCNDGKTFYWPPFKTEKKCDDAAIDKIAPDKSWNRCVATSLLGHCETFRIAENCRKLAENETDVGSEYEINLSSSSDDEINEKNEEPEISPAKQNDSKTASPNPKSVMKKTHTTNLYPSKNIISPRKRFMQQSRNRHCNPTKITKKAPVSATCECKQSIEALFQYTKLRFDALEGELKRNTPTLAQSSGTETYFGVLEYLSLPIGPEQLNTFDERLNSETEFRQTFISFLKRSTSTSIIADAIKVIMSSTYLPDVAVKYNWEGKKGKAAFRDFYSINMIKDFLYQNFTTASYKEDILGGIKRWLTNKGDLHKKRIPIVPQATTTTTNTVIPSTSAVTNTTHDFPPTSTLMTNSTYDFSSSTSYEFPPNIISDSTNTLVHMM